MIVDYLLAPVRVSFLLLLGSSALFQGYGIKCFAADIPRAVPLK